MPLRNPKPVVHDLRRNLIQLRTATKAVTKQIRKERRRVSADARRVRGSVPRSLELVCRFLARSRTDAANLVATFLLQQNPRQFVTVGAQQRFTTATAFATEYVQNLIWPDPFVDLPMSLRSPAWHRVFDRAQRHLQEFNAATWTATMNLDNRIAPASSQVTSQWIAAEPLVTDASIRRPIQALTPRSRRRRLQMWKKRWGFRWGKMRIRDAFAEHELRTKARTDTIPQKPKNFANV